MSLILDALKKADAERHAEVKRSALSEVALRPQAVPPVAVSSADRSSVHPPAESSPRWGRPLVLAAFVLLATAGVGSWVAPGGSFSRMGTFFSSAGAIVGARETLPASAALPASTPSNSPKSSEVFATAPRIAEAVVTTSQLPVPPPLIQPLPVTALPVLGKPPGKSKAAVPETSATEVLPPPMTLAQLPSQLKSEIPPLAITGSIYSNNPKERLLLVDKRMLHEGDEIAPGLVLDRVMQKGAVLRYKGYTFRVDP